MNGRCPTSIRFSSARSLPANSGHIIHGIDPAPFPDAFFRLQGCRKDFGRLASPLLAAVFYGRYPNVVQFRNAGNPLDIRNPFIRQTPLGIDILGQALPVLHKIERHEILLL